MLGVPARTAARDDRRSMSRDTARLTDARARPNARPIAALVYLAATAAVIAASRSRRAACHRPAGPQRATIPLGQAAPDAVHDPAAVGELQVRQPNWASRADLPGGLGRRAPAGKEHFKVGAAARSPLPPASPQRYCWRGRGGVPWRAGRHRPGVVTRARHWTAKTARSALSSPLAANSSANRLGNRRVVIRVPRHTTVCGSAPRSPAAGPSRGRPPAAPRTA
jgi:hypothetical protein